MPDPKTGHFTGLGEEEVPFTGHRFTSVFERIRGPDAQMSIPIDDYEKESLPSNY
jgi:hypothetical protein